MNPYLMGGIALLVIIMGASLKSSISRNGELEAKLESQAAETLECVDANRSNITSITELVTQIDEMVEQRRVDTVLREQVLDEKVQELIAAQAETDRLRGIRNDEFDSIPECAELSSLRVGFFCPATGRQLRERSRGENSNGDTDR